MVPEQGREAVHSPAQLQRTWEHTAMTSYQQRCRKCTHTAVLSNNRLARLRPSHWEGNHAWYWKPSQLPDISEVMGLRKGSSTAPWLGPCQSLLHSESYPYTHREAEFPPFLKETSLCIRRRLSQRTTTRQNAYVNRT